MKKIEAYEDPKGRLHKSAAEAAAAEICILSAPNGTHGEPIGADQAAALVANRRAVIAALQAIDAPR